MMPSPWLPVALLVFVGTAFAVLDRLEARRIGRSTDAFGTGESAHDFVGRVYRIGGAVLFAALVARAVQPGLDGALGRIPLPVPAIFAWTGVALIVAGGGLILAAQRAMGTSWRIGLPEERTALRTDGLFGVSRNPTFLGMLVLLVGAFLAAPTALAAAVLAAAFVAFSVQVRMEEAHLEGLHGEPYRTYRATVPRWLGRPQRASERRTADDAPASRRASGENS